MENISGKVRTCVCEFHGASYSSEYEIFNFVIVMVVIPLIGSFGFVNNIINVYLYTRPQSLRRSTSVYLAALACCDIMTDFCGLTLTLDSAKAYSYYLRSNLSPFLVRLWPFGQIATTCSIYFTVGAAVDCFVKVCWTTRSNSWNNLRRSRRFVFGVICASVIYNIPRFWELKSEKCFDNISNETRVEVCPTEFRMGYISNQIYNVYMHMFLMMCLPFLTLSILNALIVLQVQRKKRLQRMIASFTAGVQLVAASMRPPPRRGSIEEEEPQDDNTITLIMVVILFLVCNIFNLITNVADSLLGIQEQGLNYLSDVANALTVFNASANFLIYVTYDNKYRKSFAHHFLCVRPGNVVPDVIGERLANLKKCVNLSPRADADHRECNCLDAQDVNYPSNFDDICTINPQTVFFKIDEAVCQTLENDNIENETAAIWVRQGGNHNDEAPWVRRKRRCNHRAYDMDDSVNTEHEPLLPRRGVLSAYPDDASEVFNLLSTV